MPSDASSNKKLFSSLPSLSSMYNDLITQARLCTSQPPTGAAVSVLMCLGWLAKHVTDTPSLLLPPPAAGLFTEPQPVVSPGY